MRKLNLEIVPQGSLNHIAMKSTFQDSIISAQLHDEGIKIIKQKLAQSEEKYKCFHTDHTGVLWFDNRIVVPKDHQLWKQILDQVHLSNVVEPPKLSRLKCAGHHHKGNTDSNALQTEQFLVCRVTSRYNHRFSDRTSIPRTKASPEILQPHVLQTQAQ